MEGFTIVQLSDLHLGGVIKPKWLEQVVKKVNGLHPHLVVITGDLIEGYGWQGNGKPYAQTLKKIKSIHGVYAVSGNHDVYGGGKNFSSITKEAGITLLNNQTVTVAGCIQLAGVCDPYGKSHNRPGPGELKVVPYHNNRVSVFPDFILAESVDKLVYFSKEGTTIKQIRKPVESSFFTPVGKNVVGKKAK